MKLQVLSAHKMTIVLLLEDILILPLLDTQTVLIKMLYAPLVPIDPLNRPRPLPSPSPPPQLVPRCIHPRLPLQVQLPCESSLHRILRT